jgi:peptide/nickel transport system substrate-binding protein
MPLGLTRRRMLAAAALAGTAPRLIRAGEASAEGVAPRRGGTLTALLFPEPPLLIPGVNNQAPALVVASKIYQGLLQYSRTLQPLPKLARSWEVSEDRRRYTFHLQEKVEWHDGAPMTADDVVFSLMRFHWELSPRAQSLLARITRAEAPDPHTVIFTLDAPSDAFLLLFDVTAAAIVPKHIYEATDFRGNSNNDRPIGTGPFRFAAWQRGAEIRLERFERYWKPDQPYLDAIVYRIVPDSQMRAVAMKSGEAELAQEDDIEPFDAGRLKAIPSLALDSGGWEYLAPLVWMELNHRIRPLGDQRVRQAISHAIDRDLLVRRVWADMGRPATSPIASGIRFHDPAAKLQEHDPRRAAALLDAAGLMPGNDGIRFSLRHLVLPYGEVWTRLSQHLWMALGLVGIELVPEAADPESWARRIAAWDYETSVNFVYQYADPTIGVERTYVSSNIRNVAFANTGGYANPEVDALFAAARDAVDPNARAIAFRQAQKILIDDVPQVWLFEPSFPTIYDRRLRGAIKLGTGVHSGFDDVFLV